MRFVNCSPIFTLSFSLLGYFTQIHSIMHTILGAGGVVANEVVQELRKNNVQYQLVSRKPRKAGDERWIGADLMDAKAVKDAVKGSSVVYLVAGLAYDFRIWQDLWPRIMTNTIEACRTANAKLIFFDNVYAYGLVKGAMTESTPYNLSSKKGEVRARIATQLMEETRRGNLYALIARAADFYGPKYDKSVIGVMAFERLAKGGSAMLMMSDSSVHSYTYTPDIGKALYILAQNDSSFNQVWHVPTAPNPLTGKQFVEQIAAAFGVKPRYNVLGKFMMSILGIFNHDIKEVVEMLYQWESDYIFDSSKFEKEFSVKSTPYEVGIKEAAATYKPGA
jgi:nucleoside-diphosphate-sugar epimerase